MRILLTGGSGFIGRNVKEYFSQKGYDIYAPSSKELNCLDENKVKECLQNNYFDVIFHFAVYNNGIDRTNVLEYSLRIFMNFAKNSQLYGKMIYTGSGAEYDKRYPIQMVTEEDLTARALPVDQYGLMKYIANQMIESSDNIYNLRLFGVFGKYEYWKTKYISNLCCKSIKGLPLSLRKNCYFDYLWIDDFCHILESFIKLDRPKYHVYNTVCGNKIDLLSLAQIVNEVADDRREIFICQEGYANEYTASNERLMQELPDIEYTNIKLAVSKLYSWYKEHQSYIDIYSLIYE